MRDNERLLFDGQLGTQSVLVWLQPYGSGLGLLTHDMGSGLESVFGSDEIETFLVIGDADLPALVAALGAERTDADAPTAAIHLLADKYRGDSTATSRCRAWLTERGIPHTFSVV